MGKNRIKLKILSTTSLLVLVISFSCQKNKVVEWDEVKNNIQIENHLSMNMKTHKLCL